MTATPAYVHLLLDSLLTGAPLNFRRQPVPDDVRVRILRARAAQVAAAVAPLNTPPAQPARAAQPAAAVVPAGPPPAAAPASPAAVVAAPPSPAGVELPKLSDREFAVLRGMADGMQNKDIGAALFIGEDTVKTHARRLFRKLRARDRAHAVAIGLRAGLIN